MDYKFVMIKKLMIKKTDIEKIKLYFEENILNVIKSIFFLNKHIYYFENLFIKWNISKITHFIGKY